MDTTDAQMNDRKPIVFDLDPDQFLELCSDEAWRILWFQRTKDGYRAEAEPVERNEGNP